LNASLHKWGFVATYGELMAAITATSTVNYHRDTKKNPQPITLPMPFSGGESAEPDVTPAERAALRADLIKRSAFAT